MSSGPGRHRPRQAGYICAALPVSKNQLVLAQWGSPYINVGRQHMTELASTRWTIRRFVKVVAVAIVSLVAALFALLAAFSWWASHGIFATSRFDPAIWFAKQTNETDITCYRGGMAQDIRERLLNPGMTHEDVERVLGKPERGATTSEYRYTLGMCSGLKMDYDDLHIYFDTTGKYEKSAVIQH